MSIFLHKESPILQSTSFGKIPSSGRVNIFKAMTPSLAPGEVRTLATSKGGAGRGGSERGKGRIRSKMTDGRMGPHEQVRILCPAQGRLTQVSSMGCPADGSAALLQRHALCLELGAWGSFSQRRLEAEAGLLLAGASPWGFQDINHTSRKC